MTKHTPGPWHVVPYGDGGSLVICSDEAGDWRIAFMATPSGYKAERDEIKANAHLIASAPEMYEALERTVNHFGILPDDMTTPDSVIGQARSALRKARGEA